MSLHDQFFIVDDYNLKEMQFYIYVNDDMINFDLSVMVLGTSGKKYFEGQVFR